MDASMTLYEYSKQIIANESPMDAIIFNKKINEIVNDMINNKYLMLLCNERRDFTIFRLTDTACFKSLSKDLSETLLNRGIILLMDKQEDGAWEIWIRDSETNENFAYYLFDYSNAVVEVE